MKPPTLQLSDFWQAILTPSRSDLLFAVRNMIAGMLALYLAFIFDLEQPQWALTTVFIVGQFTSGMVLGKGAYRLAGTVVGGIASVALISLFGQLPLLFLLSMAAWLALCTTGASLLRGHAAYGFVLAGYTAAIIALPAVSDPQAVFDHATARCIEISLGIICAAVASTVLWPRHAEQGLSAQGRAAWLAGLSAAAAELLGTDQRKGLLDALGRLMAVDNQHASARFEGPKGRRRSQALRVLSRDLLSLLRAARAVARQQLMLDDSARVTPLIEDVAAALQQARHQDLPALAQQISLALEDPSLSPEAHFCLLELAQLLQLIDQGALTLHALEQGRVPPGAPGAMSWHTDIEQGVLAGLRCALAFLAVAAFWVFTAWPSGLGAISICGVVLSLFAARENPSESSLNFLKGIVISIPVAAFVHFGLLPGFDSFAMLGMCLGIPLFLASLCMSRVKLAATASAFCIFFVNNIGPNNLMTYDFAAFLNSAIATLIGGGIAVLVFRLIQLNPGERHYRRMYNALLFDLAQLTVRPLEQAESWFGGRMADRLIRLSRYSATYTTGRRHWARGLLGLDLGDELLEVRASLANSQGALAIARDRYLRSLAKAFKQQGPNELNLAIIDKPSELLLKALEQSPSQPQQVMASAAIAQLQYTWRKACQPGAE
ncbi:FUSC family protein [Pseudomonas sp. SIMBA_077]